MKTAISSKSSKQGTALLVALFLTTILAISIAGYLKHAYQQQYLSMRSQIWNTSIAVSEAGVEEALQHLNTNPTNLNANGWSQSGSTYTITRTLNANAKYEVTIEAANMTAPEITSIAHVDSPALAMSKPAMLLATIGVDADTSNEGMVRRAVRVKAGKNGMFQKPMVARYTIDMNGNNVMTDSFNSADPNYSDNGRYPAGNLAKLLDNGDVASNDRIVNAISVGNANIYGRVSVGPGGTVSVGSQGGVGTRAWQASNNGIQPGYFTDDMNFTFPTITLPYTVGQLPLPGTVYVTNYAVGYSNSLVTTTTYPSPPPSGGVTTNVSYVTASTTPIPVPYGTVTNILTIYTVENSFPKAGTYVGTPTKVNNSSDWAYYRINGTNYTYPSFTYTYSTLTSLTNYTISEVPYDYLIQGSAMDMPPLDYYVDSLPGGNVYVKGNARLVVRGDLDIGGNKSDNQITLSSNAKLEMWVGGTSAKLSGNGVVNGSGYAQNFICWCTDSVTSMSLNGNGEFVGILVAPNANVRLNGGGKAVDDFIGVLIANTIVLNGHFNFHYDEALKNLKNNGRYRITDWNEISISQVGN